MTHPPTVHVVAVGDELCSGRRQDTNGPWMARRLSELGVVPAQLHVAGDDPVALAGLLRHLARDARLLVLCGGLGPTGDDTTRQALANALDVPLREDAAAWTQVQERLATMNRVPNPLQRTQAQLPAGAKPLANPAGTAPGIQAQRGDVTLMALPGVPVEMKAMFEGSVVPWIAEHFGGRAPMRCTLWVVGVPESDLAERVEALDGARDVALAYYPHHGEIELVAQATDGAALRRFEEAARADLGDDVFDPPEGGRLQDAVVHALSACGATVAVAESLTGGGIAHLLTSVPGASDVIRASWVTYANEAKTALLGVPADLIQREGVVSEAVARAMAEGARSRAGATFGLATTGVAGPGALRDGPHRAPAGRVHVALATPTGTHAVRLDGDRPRALVRHYACVAALDLLRRSIQEGRERAPHAG